MSANKYDSRFCLCLLAILLPLEAAVSAPPENDEVIHQVREAWKSRRDAIKTFHFECELVERVTKAAKPGAGELFGDAPVGTPTIDVDLRSMIAFSYDKGTRAFKRDGQQWDENRAVPKDYMFRATFDGVYKSLLQSGSLPHGSIDRRRVPDSDLTTLSHLTAFWLAFDPEAYFKARAYDADKIQVGKQQVVLNGRECLELRLPRGNAPWEGLLYVDPQRAYVPTQFKEVHKGVEVAKLDIQYVANSEVGWVVSSWRKKNRDPIGKPSLVKAKVQDYAINSVLDKRIFELGFPTGSHITDVTDQGRKCFVQLKDGALKEIPESDYGRPGAEE